MLLSGSSASSLFRPRRFASPRAAGFFCLMLGLAMNDVFITENFLLRNDRAVEVVSRLRPAAADPRLPLPSSARRDRRGSPLRESVANLAARRPLQMEGDAGGRRAGTLLHGRRLGLGKIPEVGRNRSADASQSTLPLDAPRTETAVGHQRPAASPATAQGIWDDATRSSPGPSFRPAASCGR